MAKNDLIMDMEHCKSCRIPFRMRFKDFFQNRKKYEVEYKMLKYSLYSLLILAALEVIGYTIFFRQAGSIYRYWPWVFYADIAVISIGAAMWHLKSYKGNITTMAGMMVGMTFGMQTGLMIGAIIGATNGIFIGGMMGMITGVLAGWYNGRCCGIMGVLEGMMAGMMNGIMGGMIGTMFFADHILWFMPFFIAINLIIMWGLSYMLYEEVVEDNPKVVRKPVNFASFLGFCIIAASILITIMLYAPKSGLARVLI